MKLFFVPFFILCLFFAFSSICLGNPLPVIINEFMANPKAVSDSSGEWIELYNISSDIVNLSNWELRFNNNAYSFPDNLVINPKTYLILCRNQDETKNGFIKCDHEIPALSLTNTDGELWLINQEESVFKVSYSKNWIKEGRSTELHDYSLCQESQEGCSFPQYWHQSSVLLESGDYGTPRKENSTAEEEVSELIEETEIKVETEIDQTNSANQSDNDNNDCPDLFITELMPNPPGQDTKFNEFIEIYNPNSFKVDLKNWSLANQKNQTYVFNESVEINPSSYFLIFKKDFIFSLYNNEASVVLLCPSKKQIDNLSFSQKAKVGESLNKTDGNIYWGSLISPGFQNYPEVLKETAVEESDPVVPNKSSKKISTENVSLPTFLETNLLKNTPYASNQINIWENTPKNNLISKKDRKKEVLKFLSTML